MILFKRELREAEKLLHCLCLALDGFEFVDHLCRQLSLRGISLARYDFVKNNTYIQLRYSGLRRVPSEAYVLDFNSLINTSQFNFFDERKSAFSLNRKIENFYFPS